IAKGQHTDDRKQHRQADREDKGIDRRSEVSYFATLPGRPNGPEQHGDYGEENRRSIQGARREYLQELDLGRTGQSQSRAVGDSPTTRLGSEPPRWRVLHVQPDVPEQRRRELQHAAHALAIERGLNVLAPRYERDLVEGNDLDLLGQLPALGRVGGADPLEAHRLQ